MLPDVKVTSHLRYEVLTILLVNIQVLMLGHVDIAVSLTSVSMIGPEDEGTVIL